MARMAVLLAGCRRAPGTTVNRLCGSSLDAAMQASRMAETGDAWCVLVGGVESMSRAGGAAQARARVRDRRSDAVFDDPGMADGQPEDARGVDDSPGASTEKLAGLHGVGREAQFALTGFTQALGAELRPHDVRACLGYPGAMATHWGTWSPEERPAERETTSPRAALPQRPSRH